MRQGQHNNNKRMRGRNRKGPNPLTRSYESNGGDVKIRGTALHIAEKYVQLARDAQSSRRPGRRRELPPARRALLPHRRRGAGADAAAAAGLPQRRGGRRRGRPRSRSAQQRQCYGDRQQVAQAAQPAFGLADPQPYVNGNGQAPMDGETMQQPAPEADRTATTRIAWRAASSGDGGSRGPRGDFRSRRRRQYRDRYNPEARRRRSGAGGEPGGRGAATATIEPAAPRQSQRLTVRRSPPRQRAEPRQRSSHRSSAAPARASGELAVRVGQCDGVGQTAWARASRRQRTYRDQADLLADLQFAAFDDLEIDRRSRRGRRPRAGCAGWRGRARRCPD